MDYKRYMGSTLRQIGIWVFISLMLVVITGRLSVYGMRVVYAVELSFLVVSVVSAVLWCRYLEKDNWKFLKQGLSSGRFFRFVSRLGIIIVFLFLGGILESLDAGNYLASKVNHSFFEMPAYALCSFNLYIIVAFFPLSYAITELIFVETGQESLSYK